MSDPCEISIGLPVYNGERYLAETLDALLAQTFEDFEIIICDNASTDATREICNAYAARDARIRYIRRNQNMGAAYNYNDCVLHARGRYFKWAAHDDKIAPAFLQKCHAALEQRGSEAVLSFARMRQIGEDGETLGDYVDPIQWNGRSPARRLRSLLSHPRYSYIHRCWPVFGLIRMEALARTRLIGSFNGADKVTLVELALLGDFVEIPEFLFLKREHSGTSLAAHKSPRSLAKWFNPRARHLLVTPRNRLFIEYVHSVVRADIPLQQKLACVPVLYSTFRRTWRILGGEVKLALRERLRERSGVSA